MPQQASKKGARRQSPAGIRDIAESLGVSIGTVDRALHNRPGINQKTRTRILEQAKAMGYRPNLAARFLSSRKQLRVGVNLPSEIASFFDLVRDGILEAVRAVETSDVKLIHRSYPGLGNGEKEALAEALETDLDGLIMVPGQPAEPRAPPAQGGGAAPARGLRQHRRPAGRAPRHRVRRLAHDRRARRRAHGSIPREKGPGDGGDRAAQHDRPRAEGGRVPPGPRRDVARPEHRRGGRGPRPRAGGLREVPEAPRLDHRHRGRLRDHRQLHPGDEGGRGERAWTAASP